MWDRTDLESEARQVGIVLLAGAIDRINESVLETCDEPLIAPIDSVDRFRVCPTASEAFQ